MTYDADVENTKDIYEKRVIELQKTGCILKTEICKEEVIFQHICDKDEKGNIIMIKDVNGHKVPKNEKFLKKLNNIAYVYIYSL
jgi:hypothetical protein